MDKIWYVVYIYALVLFFISLIISVYSHKRTTKVYTKFLTITTRCGIVPQKLAIILLAKAGITDIEIAEINGKETNCYVPKFKVLKLSSSMLNNKTMTANGICAHEIGHIIQDHEKHFLYRARYALMPIINVFSAAFIPLVLIGSIFSFSFNLPIIGLIMLWTADITYTISILFYIITFSIEINATNRATKLIHECDFFIPEEVMAMKVVLNATALTYTITLAASMLFFINFLSLSRLFEE